MVTMAITPVEPNDTYDAVINADFSYSSPFIVEGDITYDDGAVSPIDQDVTLTLQKSTNDFDTLLPNATLKPKINDEFVFVNINLPDTYIISAEQRVETALIDYLNKNNFYRNSFSIDIDRKWIAENNTEANKIVLGNKIRLLELTEDLDITNITITHSDNELLDKYDIQISPTLKRISNTNKKIGTLSNRTLINSLNTTLVSKETTQSIAEIQTKAVSTQAPPPDATPNNVPEKIVSRDNSGNTNVNELICVNLRVPKTLPVNKTSGEWYLYIV